MIQQMPKTSVDMLIDNLAYASDILAEMTDRMMAIKRCLPPIDAMRDVAYSADYPAIYSQNSFMADTSTLVWSLENSKNLLTMIGSQISETD